ncbi:restriction endonuclease subunit S [Clostridium septicum]|uniref:restriction endonuclease subunit S n=1 Tax=Clostridium septicum TaxID=1504 RepID=UPI00272E2057|nr:restriction endonuclease subunit S [Clostridium septicum]WLF68914.1 restriction endonuclease subunit S [Clostridium septicum]
MEYIKLGELFKITSGGTPNKKNNEFYYNGNIPWIKTADLKVKDIIKSSEYITELAVQKSSAKLFPKQTVLIAMYGATIGATSILRIEATTNQACCAFLPNDKIASEYLYYFFKANKQKIVNMGVGGAQPNISASILKGIKIPFINLDRQLVIVEILDKAQELIDKRKEQIQALDELIKSQFIEMFGDPVSNPKGWKKAVCKEITSKIGSGATPSGGNSSYKEEGISLIRSMNVHNNKFVYKDLAFIDDEQAKKLKNVIIEENDILLNITGASVARSCIVPSSILPARVNQHVSIIRCKTEEILPIFLVYQFTSQSYQRKLWDIATSGGATREAITKQQLENLELIVPPIELQNQFADFVKQVDKLKVKMEKSLKELEDNFNSLMQRAFNGELFSE